MPTDFKYDVFLSHNSADKPRVRKLAERLKQAGLRVWFDDWIIQPGDDIYLAIEHGLETSRTQVLCLSPAALGSDWVALERSTVLFRDPTNAGRRFIPLLLADCKLPDALRRYRHVDFREEAAPAFGELLAACRSKVEVGPHAQPLGTESSRIRAVARPEIGIDVAACQFVGMRLTARGTACGGEAVVPFWRTGTGRTPEERRYWCSIRPIPVVSNAWEVPIDLKNRAANRRFLLVVLGTEENGRRIIETVGPRAIDNEVDLMAVIGKWVAAKAGEVVITRTGQPVP